MAIKTDISKAYDFKWVDWVMSCLKTVSYSILINGSPYGFIQPQRGIRQGDPLSPYLFLRCAEILSQKMDAAQTRNKLQGLAISNGGPRVHHFFFANDSLFFCKANAKDNNKLVIF